MRAAVLLLAALALATVPAPPAASQAGCLPVDADELVPLASLPGLPEGWEPFLALKEARIPPVPSLAARGPAGLCDLTHGLAGFAALAGVDAAEQRAALAAAVSFPDQLGIPEPRSVEILGGVAKVETWSEKDGLVTAWQVDLRTLEAEFVVREVGVGAFASEMEGWHPWPGFSSAYLEALDAGALVTKQHLAANPDGSQWRITYFTQNYASEAEADSYALKYGEAGKAVYGIEVLEWGYPSADPDKVYDVTADGCNCIFGGFNTNIHVSPKLESLMIALGLEYPTFESFYRVVIGHEFHHHLQYSIQQWKLGGALVEGGARFSETVFEPAGAHGPRTITYLMNANGLSNMMLNPNVAIANRAYDFGLFWGHLYSQDGGIDILREVYEESNNVAGGGPNNGIPEAVTRALANVPNPRHATFEEAYADMALAMFTKSFVWGKADGSEPRDWGLFLPPVKRVAMESQADGAVNVLATATVEPRGLFFVDAKRPGPLLTHYVGDAALLARWVWLAPDGLHTAPAGLTTPIPEVALQDAALAVVRGADVGQNPGALLGGGKGRFRAAVEALAEASPS